MSRPRTAIEAARLVRADIKQAVRSGSLGDLPAGITFSVSSPRMGLHRPVLVSVQNAPQEWAFSKGARTSAAATALAWTLRDILGKHWSGRIDVDGMIVCGIREGHYARPPNLPGNGGRIPMDDAAEINWDAPLTSKHRALELLAYMVREEFGLVPISEVIATWGPVGLAERDIEMIRDVFPDKSREQGTA